jgi:inner membrane protein
MLTAHLPSGYLLGRAISRTGPGVMAATLVGSVLPDLDIFWFYFVDRGAYHHHHYWPHIPAVWAGIALLTLPILAFRGRLALGLAFFAAILVHLILDTIAGGVNWAWPYSDSLFAFVEIPATYSHWVISFVLHWTFLLELLIWAVAAWTYLGKKAK